MAGLAGAIYKPSYRSPIASVTEFKEIRDLRHVRDKLISELDELKNTHAKLGSKSSKLEQSNFSYQRDLKILRTLFEKANSEKHLLDKELTSCKEEQSRLERQLSKLGDAGAMSLHIDTLKVQVDSLNEELSKFQHAVQERDDKIKLLNKEIDALNMSLDNHVYYEGGKKTRTVGKETLRNMYFELGKKQAETHSLSLSLSDAHADLSEMRTNYEASLQEIESLKADIGDCNDRYSYLTKTSEKLKEENASLLSKNSQFKDTTNRLEDIIEDLSHRVSEQRQALEEVETELTEKSADLELLKEDSHTEIQRLTDQIESLRVALTHKENVHFLVEQRISSEWNKINAEKDKLKDTDNHMKKLKDELNYLREQTTKSLDEKNIEIRGLKDEIDVLNQSRSQVSISLQAEEIEKRNKQAKMAEERNTLARMVQESLSAYKTLQTRFQEEVNNRLDSESKLENALNNTREIEEKYHNSLRAKEQYAFAVLDSFQKSKERCMQLEKILEAHGISIDFVSPPQPPSEVLNSRQNIHNKYSDSVGLGDTLNTSNLLPKRSASPSKFSSSSSDRGKQSPVSASGDFVSQTHDLLGEIQRMRGEINRMSKSLPNPINESPFTTANSSADQADLDTSTVSTTHGARDRTVDGSGSDKDMSVYYNVEGEDDM